MTRAAGRPPSWPAATGCCRREPGAELASSVAGAVAPEALEALAAVREDIPGAGLLHVTSADRLDADWRRRGRRRRAQPRAAGAAGPRCRAGDRARRAPGDAVVAGCGARASRAGAGRRPLRPVGRPGRPLPRARPGRRRHPGRLRRGPAATLKRRLSWPGAKHPRQDRPQRAGMDGFGEDRGRGQRVQLPARRRIRANAVQKTIGTGRRAQMAAAAATPSVPWRSRTSIRMRSGSCSAARRTASSASAAIAQTS